MKNAVIAPSAISMIQKTVEASRRASFFAPVLQQFREDRHERGRERRVGEQVAHQVGHLEGDREGASTRAGPEEAAPR